MQLQRTLGWKEATSIGVGAMVGAGIFVLSGVATGKAGPAVIISFILAALLAILLGLCYGELASRYPRAGGSYEYARETMGSFIGTIVGWSYWGAWLAASSFVSQGFGHYLNALTGAPPKVSAVLLLIGLGTVNIAGIQFSGKFQVGVVCTVIVVLIGFVILGAKHVDLSYFQPFSPYGFSGIAEAALVGFLSIVGWDAIVASGEEIRNPKKTIPLAIFTSIIVVLVLYLGLLFVSIGVMPWQEFSASDVPVALASQQFLGKTGPILISIVIVLALPATCNAFILTISRTAFAMGRNGLLPKKFAYVHARFQTPVWAIVLGVSIQIAFTFISSINIAVTATGFLYLFTFIFTLIAYFISRKKVNSKEKETQFYAPFYPVIPASALLICLGLLIPIGKSGILTGSLWLSIGVVLYFLRRRQVPCTTSVLDEI